MRMHLRGWLQSLAICCCLSSRAKTRDPEMLKISGSRVFTSLRPRRQQLKNLAYNLLHKKMLKIILSTFISLLCINTASYAQYNSNRGGTPGSFDFYVLALSWSSGFCANTGDRQGKQQCDIGSNIGFTVHGLWPQYERGFPSECGFAERSPSYMALQKAEGVFPDLGLARYEWRKHGTCSGLSPADYFDAVKSARVKINVPENFQSPRAEQKFSPIEIIRSFVDNNKGLRADMMAVGCKRGVLEEVRICFEKDLRSFKSCPEVARKSCRGGEVTVPPVR
jgi:ribonuclease T2